MLTHVQVLIQMVSAHAYASYLEIGVKDPVDCFDKIPCPRKVSVDPEQNQHSYTHNVTSDVFFAQNTDKFDLIFIDGLHIAEQVEKDILSALAVLNNGGTIAVHDTNPSTHAIAGETDTKGAWCGTVWRAIFKLRDTRHDLQL